MRDLGWFLKSVRATRSQANVWGPAPDLFIKA